MRYTNLVGNGKLVCVLGLFLLFFPFVLAYSCSETDNGFNPYVNSTATVVNILGQTITYTERCQPDNRAVYEYYCTGITLYGAIAVPCPLGCVNATCVQATCRDSDNGNHYVNGSTNRSTETASAKIEDYCSGNNLVESSCNGSEILRTYYDCPYGCNAGACVSTAPACIDSDNGVVFTIPGNASGFNPAYNKTDVLFDNCVDNYHLEEAICDSNQLYYSSPLGDGHYCPGGCVNGACVFNESCESYDFDCDGTTNSSDLLAFFRNLNNIGALNCPTANIYRETFFAGRNTYGNADMTRFQSKMAQLGCISQEVCNGIDDNKNGLIDEGCDKDGDSYYDSSMTCNNTFISQGSNVYVEFPTQRFMNFRQGWSLVPYLGVSDLSRDDVLNECDTVGLEYVSGYDYWSIPSVYQSGKTYMFNSKRNCSLDISDYGLLTNLTINYKINSWSLVPQIPGVLFNALPNSFWELDDRLYRLVRTTGDITKGMWVYWFNMPLSCSRIDSDDHNARVH